MTARVSASGIERSGAIRSYAMKRDHHAGNRNHSVGSGADNLSGYELRPSRNPVTVGRRGIELLGMSDAGANDN